MTMFCDVQKRIIRDRLVLTIFLVILLALSLASFYFGLNPAAHENFHRYWSFAVSSLSLICIIPFIFILYFGKDYRVNKYYYELEDIIKDQTDQVEKSNKRFEDFTISTLDWVWETDQEGRYTYVSKNVEKVLGYSPDYLLGKSYFDIMPEDEKSKIIDLFKSISLEKMAIVNLKNWVLTSDGRRVLLLTNGVPVLGKTGELIGYRGVDRDISFEFSRASKLSVAYDIINSSPAVAFLWKNEEGWPVEYVSQNVSTLLGYTAKQFIDGEISFYSVIHNDDREQVKEEVVVNSKNLNVSFFKHKPYRIIKQSGVVRYVDDMTYIRRDADGAIINYQGILIDVTERVIAEASRDELEGKLVHSSRLTSFADMASGIAQEIDNPLAVIRGIVRRIHRVIGREIFDRPKVESYLDDISDVVERIEKVVSGLKLLTRDGRKDLLEEVNFAEFVREIVGLSFDKFSKAGIEIILDIDATKYMIEARRVQLAQVLINLLNNSYDAIIEGALERWIRITLSLVDENVELRIVDGGKGIPDNIADKMMYPFFTTKPVGKGVGLGLSVSRGIVEAIGGTLKFDKNSPNTCFVIILPRLK